MYEVFAKYSIDKKNYFSYIAIRKARKAHSPVAQSAEQVAVNHWVPGSSPGGGASEAVVKRQSPFLLSGTVTIHNIRPPPGLGGEQTAAWPEQSKPFRWLVAFAIIIRGLLLMQNCNIMQ